MTNKKLITTILITIPLLLVSIIILYYPLFNLQSSVRANPQYNQTTFVLNNYNPFQPRISAITKLSGNDGYWVIVSDYQRTGLFEYTYIGEVNGIKKPIDLGLVNATITNKTLEEVKQIVTKQDLSKTQYVPQKSDAVKEYEVEQTKAPECQRAIRVGTKYSEPSLSFLYKNLKYSELSSFAGEGNFNKEKTYFLSINIESQNVIKYNLYFGKISPALDDSIELTRATKVYNDCREEEIILPEKQ